MVISLIVILFTALPASAQTEAWAVGGGYWTMPNVDDSGGTIDTAGMFVSVNMRSMNYMIELDYSLDDPGFMGIAADYLYPLSQEQNYFGGSAFVGAGYTYFSADDLENESGFNLLVGTSFSENFLGTIRYDFLGSDQEIIVFGISYSFY